MTAKTPTAEDLREEFEQLRAEGMSYREIGERYSLSHERVRQVVGSTTEPEVWADRKRRERAAWRDEIAAWLEEHGPVTRDALAEAWSLSPYQVSRLVNEGLPSHLIMSPERTRERDFDTDDIIKALRRSWKALQAADPTAIGLSHANYEAYRSVSEPSAALVTSRYGWDVIAEIADVPTGGTRRPKESYTSSWSDDDILHAIKEYVEESREAGARPTYVGYEEWQRGRDYAPSGSTVRNRGRQMDPALDRWPQIVAAALAR